jgi:hypothetical protein
LRDFVELVAPVLAQKQDQEIEQDAVYLLPLILAASEVAPEKLPLDEASRSKIVQLIDDRVEFDIEEGEGGEKTVRIRGSGDYVEASTRAFRGLRRRHYHEGLLYGSSLINLICSTEWFLAQLLHQYFERFPEAIGERGKTFSLEDLESIGSIEDARAYIVDAVVEEVLREGFEKWLDFLQKKMNLSMGYLEENKSKLIEVFQRRNILIHNGGFVNRIYLVITHK